MVLVSNIYEESRRLSHFSGILPTHWTRYRIPQAVRYAIRKTKRCLFYLLLPGIPDSTSTASLSGYCSSVLDTRSMYSGFYHHRTCIQACRGLETSVRRARVKYRHSSNLKWVLIKYKTITKQTHKNQLKNWNLNKANKYIIKIKVHYYNLLAFPSGSTTFVSLAIKRTNKRILKYRVYVKNKSLWGL